MPVIESAIDRHDRMVREERDQAERLRTDQASADIWTPNARRFRPAADIIDPAVEVLAAMVAPDGRAIDVGAGGGRIALPLALRVREVVAVEPSPAMREVLHAEISRRGVTNIEIVPKRWEEAGIDAADLAFAAHVTYGVLEIEPFLRKLDNCATRHAALVAFTDPPQHFLAPFWKAVYGEERLRLPGRFELVEVLRELGVEPQVTELPPQEVGAIGPAEDAPGLLRRRLFIGEEVSQYETPLRETIEELTEERDGQLWLATPVVNPMAVIWWEPVGL